MKKFISVFLASAIVCSPVFAQSSLANGVSFVPDASGRPTTVVQDGRTYYQVRTNGATGNSVAPAYTPNVNFVTDANGQTAVFTQDGRTYYQAANASTMTPAGYTTPGYNTAPVTQNYQAVGTYANQNLTTVPGATYVATGGAPAIAPAAAAYGYNGSNMILYATGAAMIGVAILASVSRSTSTTSNH